MNHTMILFVYAMIILGVFVGLAFIPACIARRKGRSFGGYFAFGLFLFFPALIVALAVRNLNNQPQFQNTAPYQPANTNPPQNFQG